MLLRVCGLGVELRAELVELRQVAEVRGALELLDGSKKIVNQLRGNFQTIDQ